MKKETTKKIVIPEVDKKLVKALKRSDLDADNSIATKIYSFKNNLDTTEGFINQIYKILDDLEGPNYELLTKSEFTFTDEVPHSIINQFQYQLDRLEIQNTRLNEITGRLIKSIGEL